MESASVHTANLVPHPDLIWSNQSLMFSTMAPNNSFSGLATLPPALNKATDVIMSIVVFITMVSMGCTTEVSQIKQCIVKPKGVVIALLAQYGVMPLTAFCLVKMFQLSDISAVVVLVCGCCPGGNLSNIMTLALQGNMNLSIVMTTCSTLLALGLMPLLLYFYCWGLNLQNSVPYVEIIISLVMILIPCGAGILINYYRPQYSKTITKVGLIILLIASVCVGFLVGFALRDALLLVLSPSLMGVSAVMPLTGYTFGYTISWLFRFNQSERRTVSVETGCQNIKLCATILKLAFPPKRIGPLFMFPVVYAAFQLMEAALLVMLFRCYQWFTLKDKELYQPAVTDDNKKDVSEGAV